MDPPALLQAEVTYEEGMTGSNHSSVLAHLSRFETEPPPTATLLVLGGIHGALRPISPLVATLATSRAIEDLPARDAKNRFGQLLDAAQAAPARVTKRARPVAVLMSVTQHERLRGPARVSAEKDVGGPEAAVDGMTEDELDRPPADEG